MTTPRRGRFRPRRRGDPQGATEMGKAEGGVAFLGRLRTARRAVDVDPAITLRCE